MANHPVSTCNWIAWAWQSHVTYTYPRTSSSIIIWITVTPILTDVIADLHLCIEVKGVVTEQYIILKDRLASFPGSLNFPLIRVQH